MKRARTLCAMAFGTLAFVAARSAIAGGPGPDATTERMLRHFESIETDWFFVEIPADDSIAPPEQRCVAVDQGARSFGLDVPPTTIPQDLIIALRGHSQSARLQGAASDDHFVLIVGSDIAYTLARGRSRCLALAAEVEPQTEMTRDRYTPDGPPAIARTSPWYAIDMNGRGPVSCVPAATLVKQLGGRSETGADPHALADALVATGQHLRFVNQDDSKGVGAVFMGYANSPTEQAYVLERGLDACQAQKAKLNAALVMSRLQSR